jgi:hypothetical protein
MSGWIGVDFDGTLAEYGTWQGADHCGAPIKPMVERVKGWLAKGIEVRIFTARIHPLDRCVMPDEPLINSSEPSIIRTPHWEAITAVLAIRAWCVVYIGRELPVTNVKDYGMHELYDDRAVQVQANTGQLVGHSTRGLA